jgi:hypothetical protein
MGQDQNSTNTDVKLKLSWIEFGIDHGLDVSFLVTSRIGRQFSCDVETDVMKMQQVECDDEESNPVLMFA